MAATPKPERKKMNKIHTDVKKRNMEHKASGRISPSKHVNVQQEKQFFTELAGRKPKKKEIKQIKRSH